MVHYIIDRIVLQEPHETQIRSVPRCIFIMLQSVVNKIITGREWLVCISTTRQFRKLKKKKLTANNSKR